MERLERHRGRTPIAEQKLPSASLPGEEALGVHSWGTWWVVHYWNEVGPNYRDV